MTFRTRRRRVGFAALATLSLLAAAACGSDDDDDTTDTEVSGSSTPGSSAPASSTPGSSTPGTTAAATTTLPSDLDPNGILKYGTALVSGVGVHFDPAVMQAAPPGLNWGELIYGTLMRETTDGTVEPWMAEDVEVVDPLTVRITLRPGATFTDGSAYDAEAVKTGLMRTRFESATAAVKSRVEANVGFGALTGVNVIDPLTVEAKLDEPVASLFITELASIFGMIPSPKQIAESPADIDTKPVGAGPFVMERFVTDQVIELRKNAGFWDADAWLLAGIDLVHTPNGPPQTNGLLSDTIDLVRGIPVGDLSVLKGDSELTTKVTTLAANSILTCPTKPPFDNEAVRKAIQIGFNRDTYNQLVYDGLAEPAYGGLKADNPSFDPALKQELAFNLDKAKKILSDANVGEVSFDLITLPSHNYGPNVEVIQSQLKELGITVNIVPMMSSLYTDWIEPQKPGALIAPMGGTVEPGTFLWFSLQAVKGGSGAFCGWENPALMAALREAAALPPGDPKIVEKFREANRLYVDGAAQIPLVFEPEVTGWNKSRIGGTLEFVSAVVHRPLLEGVYVKK